MDIIVFLISLFFVSLAIASISYTISKTEIFISIRIFISKKSSWLTRLLNCPYCVSHWISIGMVLYIYRTFSFEVFVVTFAMITLSSFWIGKISRSFDFMT